MVKGLVLVDKDRTCLALPASHRAGRQSLALTQRVRLAGLRYGSLLIINSTVNAASANVPPPPPPVRQPEQDGFGAGLSGGAGMGPGPEAPMIETTSSINESPTRIFCFIVSSLRWCQCL